MNAEQKNVSSHNPLYQRALYEYNNANLKIRKKAKIYGILYLVAAVLVLVFLGSFFFFTFSSGHDPETMHDAAYAAARLAMISLFLSGVFVCFYIKNKQEINAYIRKLRPLENFVVTHQNSLNYLRQKTSELANEQQIAENELLYQSYLEKQAVVDDYRARYPELQFKDIEKPRQSS